MTIVNFISTSTKKTTRKNGIFVISHCEVRCSTSWCSSSSSPSCVSLLPFDCSINEKKSGEHYGIVNLYLTLLVVVDDDKFRLWRLEFVIPMEIYVSQSVEMASSPSSLSERFIDITVSGCDAEDICLRARWLFFQGHDNIKASTALSGARRFFRSFSSCANERVLMDASIYAHNDVPRMRVYRAEAAR